ncbi:hypothetical protein CEY11_21380 [Candidimonas nitroreducens]|uniref:Uncharacterized protein n=1 Tax=Candidimonas nitroreducens TaxID=683354 RepID=A0A225M1N2_9BURK|nr:hypothetical protein CEY11_21380 [Candidimonas nitroreducens]
MHAELKVYKDRATALEQAAAQPAAPPAPAPTPAPLVTDKDVETYGPELMDVIGRKAQEIADGIVAKRLEELKPTLEQTNERIGKAEAQVYQTAQDRFFGELAKAVPDYKQVNGDPKWLAWLQEVDPLSGVQRQAYLDTAAGSLDHARVATLFTAFKKAAGVEAPPAEPSPASAPTPGTPPLSPSPRAVGVAVAQTPREPDNSVSRSEIDAHYKRSSLDPSYRKSPEHQAMEARIAAAMASGRIR